MTNEALHKASQQALGALSHCRDAIIERGLNGNPEFAAKWGLTLPLESSAKAIEALRAALTQEQTKQKQLFEKIETLPAVQEMKSLEPEFGELMSKNLWSLMGEAKPLPAVQEPTTQISSDGAAAIDQGVKWRKIDKDTPQGVKMQLINKWSGVAHYGVWPQGRDFFDHWAPMPTFDKDN